MFNRQVPIRIFINLLNRHLATQTMNINYLLKITNIISQKVYNIHFLLLREIEVL
jgi:hypothetical protein